MLERLSSLEFAGVPAGAWFVLFVAAAGLIYLVVMIGKIAEQLAHIALDDRQPTSSAEQESVLPQAKEGQEDV